MFKNLSQVATLLRNAHGISGKLNDLADDLKQRRVVGSAGGELVQVEVNGLGHVLSVNIDPQLIEAGERDMIQCLLPAAINDAVGKAKQMHVDAMRDFTGGMTLPGMDSLIDQFTQSPDSPMPTPADRDANPESDENR